MDPARTRLAKAMDERRKLLRLKWADVARRADGMSQQHLLRIRNDQVPLTPEATASIEGALDWAPGSVHSIMSGGAPVTKAAAAPPRPRWESYQLTADEAINLLQLALADYGEGGFWQRWDWITVNREGTQRTSDESPSDHQGRPA